MVYSEFSTTELEKTFMAAENILAFPEQGVVPGLTLRDYFAMQAMAGDWSHCEECASDTPTTLLEKRAQHYIEWRMPCLRPAHRARA